MAGPGNILITVGADTVAAVRNLGKVNNALGDTMKTSEKMGAGLRKAAAPAALALGAIAVAGISAAKAAMEDAQSADHLAQTMKRVAGSSDAAVASMEDYIDKTARATGVADDKLRPAMEKLITATGDQAKAQKLMNQVLDIAAATGKDVDTVSTAVAKGYQGQTAALSKLVPGLSEASRTSKDFTVIMDELSQKTGGAAATAAETAAGKMARFQVAVGELQESLGYALLPVIQAVIPVMLKMADFAQDNVTVIKILVGVVAGLAAGILAANVALKAYEAIQVATKVATAAWTAAQWLLNAALDANPIGAVVLALTALAAGILLAYNRSETFRTIVHGALHAVADAADALTDAWKKTQAAAQAAFDWIVGHWKIALFALGPIGAAIYILVTQWDNVRNAAENAADAVAGAARTIAGAISRMASAISGAISNVLGYLDDLAGKLDWVVGKVGDLIGWIDKIPSIPHVPGFPHFGLPFQAAPAGGSASGFASTPSPRLASPAPIVVNVYGALDAEGVARQIERILSAHRRRQGLTP